MRPTGGPLRYFLGKKLACNTVWRETEREREREREREGEVFSVSAH